MRKNILQIICHEILFYCEKDIKKRYIPNIIKSMENWNLINTLYDFNVPCSVIKRHLLWRIWVDNVITTNVKPLQKQFSSKMCGYRKLKKNADFKISAFITLQEKLYKLVHGGYSFLKSHARIVCPY